MKKEWARFSWGRTRRAAWLTSTLVLCSVSAAKAQYWTTPGGGMWDNPGNWAPAPWPTFPPAPFPNAIGATADFQYIPAMIGPINITATPGSTFVVGTVNLEADGAGGGYVLGNMFDLVFDNGGLGSMIGVNPAGYVGDHVVDSRIWLNDHLVVNLSTGDTLTINGVIADWPGPFPPPNTIPKTLATSGWGTVILTGANTFTGAFRVGSNTTLELQDPSASGTVTGGTSFGNAIGNTGTLYLNGIAGDVSIIEGDLHMLGTPSSAAVIQSANGNNSLTLTADLIVNANGLITTLGGSGKLDIIANSVQINPTGLVLTLDNALGTDLVFYAPFIGPGDVSKIGAGRTILMMGSPGWSGSLTINNGVIEIQDQMALGIPAPGQVTVMGGASLHINNTTLSTWVINKDVITINGIGTLGEGSIFNEAGNNIIAFSPTPLQVTSTSTIGVENGTTLRIERKVKTLPGVLEFDTRGSLPSSSTLTFTDEIYGPTDISKVGRGTTVFEGTNTYLGVTKVSQGVLLLKTDFALGDVGGDTYVVSDAAIHLARTPSSADISIQENNIFLDGDGVDIDLDGVDDGAITNIIGKNQIFSYVELTSNAVIGAVDASPNPSILYFQNKVNLQKFNLGLYTEANTRIHFFAPIYDAGAATPGNVYKYGDGTAIFETDNYYHGKTDVLDGVLTIRSNNSLGDLGGGTWIYTGGSLYLEPLASSGIVVPEKDIHINNYGSGLGDGAISNIAGFNTITGNIHVDSDSMIRTQAGAIRFTGNTDISGGDLILRTDAGTSMDYTGPSTITGNPSMNLIKDGTGIVTITGGAANTFAGKTIVNNGTLALSKPAGTDAIGGGTVQINGGTLLLNASDQINNSINMVLGGGTFNTNSQSEILGTLTLTANSIIDMGLGSSIIHFANSSALAWSGILSIWNWSGTAGTGGGTDQLYFGGSSLTGLTASQLSQIMFYSDSGITAIGSANWASLGTGEIVPVPEAEVWWTAGALVLFAAWRERRKISWLL